MSGLLGILTRARTRSTSTARARGFCSPTAQNTCPRLPRLKEQIDDVVDLRACVGQPRPSRGKQPPGPVQKRREAVNSHNPRLPPALAFIIRELPGLTYAQRRQSPCAALAAATTRAGSAGPHASRPPQPLPRTTGDPYPAETHEVRRHSGCLGQLVDLPSREGTSPRGAGCARGPGRCLVGQARAGPVAGILAHRCCGARARRASV